MAKTQKVSETLTNAKNENVMETLTQPQENANVQIAPNVSETVKPTIDELSNQIKNAKKELAELNDKFDYDDTNSEIIAKETEISKLVAERKSIAKENEKLELERQFNEALATAKNDLIDKLGITNEKLEELLANAKNVDAKDTLVSSFNTVFGKKVLFVSENTTGKTLAKQSAKSNGNGNITKTVKDMLTAGNESEDIVNAIMALNTDMDETKAKKRLNDIRWGWEIENGLRKKP
jgi:hypothetical protein